jgi:transposase
VKDYSEVFVGMDVSKSRIAVGLAEGGGAGEVRFLGEIEASEASVTKLVRRLSGSHGKLTFCYEAGPTGYGLYRLIGELGHECRVVAPSLIPRKPGDRVKTNRRDALSLARLLRAGELTASGRRTSGTRRCAISCGRARRPPLTSGSSGSRRAPSC